MLYIDYDEYHSFPDGTAPFSGNPAGVCYLREWLPDQALAGIAASNNHAETSYLVQDTARPDTWHLRWFTPSVEVDLCGHATLAAAAALFDRDQVKSDTAVFKTRSGELTVTKTGTDIVMSLPALPPRRIAANEDVSVLMGSTPPMLFFEAAGPTRVPLLMLEYETESMVGALKPDIAGLGKLGINVIATAPGQRSDIASRFFAPASGIDEDPVTGSAHCILAPYWIEKLGKPRLSARQIGPRPGALSVELDAERVLLFGQARKYLSGQIFID